MEEKNEQKAPINGGFPLHTYNDVEELFSNYIFSDSDKKSIRDAYLFVEDKHKLQFRKSGEPYIHHLIEVAYIVAELHGGPATLIAALLHDVVEDTDVPIEYIEKTWGSEVAVLVDSLTKIQRLKLSKITAEEFEAEDHRKILIGMAKDIRVILVKLADRLHNLRTLQALNPDRQLAISKETMEVFVPIAHRLGLDKIKSEMEDLCLKYIEPAKFDEITKLLSKKAKTMNKSLDNLKKRIADILFEKNIPFDISARVKSIYSIYAKMYLKNHSFNEIYDILALRVITDTESHCYEILGLIHKIYKPVPGRFKDYIAMPKPNMYQSLHTTIVSGDGNFYEIQIRTQDMDDIAESGVAAHWAYKEGSGYNSKQEQREIENKLHWFRDFVSLSNDISNENASDYMSSLTHDIFESNVYVFTPKGKVVELPQGSTPLDFAYRIHTKVGDSCVGAVVNGALVPLNTVLKTGEMVEVKTSKTSDGPKEGWLDFVQTNQAKACIRKYLAKKNESLLRDEKILKGKQSCIDAFTERDVDEATMMTLLSDQKTLDNFNVPTVDDLFIAVTGRKPTTNAIIEFLKIKKAVEIPTGGKVKTLNGDQCPVYCNGADNIAITLANCCTPIPGDEIIGYITRGKGITVHRKSCPNILNEKERLIDVYWRNDIQFATYPVDLSVISADRNNLLADIMYVLTSNKVTVTNLHAHANQQNLTCTINLTLMVSDAKRLTDVSNILKSVNGVISIQRVIH